MSNIAAPPLRTAPNWFQWGYFPLLLTAVVVASWYLMSVVGMRPATAILAPQFTALLLIALAEWRYPYHREWLRSHGDVRVDLTHTAGIGVLTMLVTPLLASAGVAVGGWLSQQFGSGLWPGAWPLPLQIVLALLLSELPGYWVHRWQHNWDWLWRFHSVHHSVPRLYWLNAGRFHPVDMLCTYVPSYLLLVAAGCPESVLAYFAVITAVHGLFQHSNLQMRCGPLTWFFSTAELHRWHHSRVLAEANSNYGQTVSVWDWVFGTRYLPRDRQPPQAIGIADLPRFPTTWGAQMLAPFRWQRVKRDSAA